MNRLRIPRPPVEGEKPPSELVEVVDTEVQPKPIHPVSRGAALVLGGAMIAASGMLVVMSLVTLFTSGWAEFLEVVPLYLVAFVPLWLWLGRKLLRAGMTGLDPDSEDRAMEATESRAFLAAVEKHEAGGETPPGHAPPGAI